MRWLLLVGLLMLLPAHVAGQWKTHDVILATTAVTFALTDYSTTMNAIRRCEPYGHERHCFHGDEECVEGNPLIGCFPSPAKLRVFTVVSIAGEIFVGSRLHGWKRTAWFAGLTAVSFALTQRNVGNGFHLTLRL